MTALMQFMASTNGRLFRGVVGVVLMVLGAIASGGLAVVLYVLGVFFLAVGIFDVCVLAPLAHLPVSGKGIRARHV